MTREKKKKKQLLPGNVNGMIQRRYRQTLKRDPSAFDSERICAVDRHVQI